MDVTWKMQAEMMNNVTRKTDNTGIGCDILNWIQLAQDKIQQQTLVNMVMNLDLMKTEN
jgi:hypothetical protein